MPITARLGVGGGVYVEGKARGPLKRKGINKEGECGMGKEERSWLLDTYSFS